MKHMKKYSICAAVKGFYEMTVEAESYKQAMEIVNDKITEADFGPLKDIDWKFTGTLDHINDDEDL